MLFIMNIWERFQTVPRLHPSEIPASVEIIEDGAFQDCTALTTVTFEEGSQLKTIGYSAFSRSGLQSIEIPASVKTIGRAAFKRCTALTTVTFEKRVTTQNNRGRSFYCVL